MTLRSSRLSIYEHFFALPDKPSIRLFVNRLLILT